MTCRLLYTVGIAKKLVNVIRPLLANKSRNSFVAPTLHYYKQHEKNEFSSYRAVLACLTSGERRNDTHLARSLQTKFINKIELIRRENGDKAEFC